MYAIPNKIQALSGSDLTGLNRYLKTAGVSHFKKFVNDCLQAAEKTKKESAPSGQPIDLYYWGLYDGIMRVHDMYKNLGEHTKNEMERRKIMESQNPIDN